MQAPHLYVITDRHATGGRPVADVLAGALAAVGDVPGPGGGPWRIAVQLRDKDLDGRTLFAHAERLRQLTNQHGCALFVNGRLDVALAVAADGVHLGHGALPIAVVRSVAPQLGIAVSAHCPADLRLARAQAAHFAVYGPVFATPSKAGILAPVGLLGLAEAAAEGLPLVALGGVNAGNVASCVQAGAVGVAGIRLVMAAPSPGWAMVGLLKALAGLGRLDAQTDS